MTYVVGNYLKLPASTKFGISGACAALCYTYASTNPITLLASAALAFVPDVVNRCLGKNRQAMVLLQQQVSDSTQLQPLHSQARVIPDVLLPEDGRALFELSKNLYAGIKNNLPPNLKTYYFDNSFNASSPILFGTSTPEAGVTIGSGDKAGDMFRAAKKTGEIFSNFLSYIQKLDKEIRKQIPEYKRELIWEMKLYSQIDTSNIHGQIDPSNIHGQTWHQDSKRISDVFLYYYRTYCDNPTFAVSSNLSASPGLYDKINPPNNSFVYFKNQLHMHKGMTTKKDGDKLLIFFGTLDKNQIS